MAKKYKVTYDEELLIEPGEVPNYPKGSKIHKVLGDGWVVIRTHKIITAKDKSAADKIASKAHDRYKLEQVM